MSVRLSELPDFEPPQLWLPPDPDERLDDDWYPPPPPQLVYHPPTWDEPGDLRDHVHLFVLRVLEVLNGRRPVVHLWGLVTGHIYESMLTRTQHATGHQHRLNTLRTCAPAYDKLELCATVLVTAGRTPQLVTMAARLEHRRERWIFTVLRLLYPRQHPVRA
jgi:hypothetical protein